jgi:RNA polymerase sigma-54 factor
MAIKLSQSMKQTQSLMMTPQLQQAIKLLTLTHLEMTNVIAEEMVENPMLEEFGGEVDKNDKSEEDYKVEKLETQNKEATAENFSEEPVMQKDDFDWSSYVESTSGNNHTPPSMATQDFDDFPSYENIVSRGQSLQDHLEWQLKMEEMGDDEWILADLIIGNIDDSGYLQVKFDELIAETKFDREDAFEILKMIQHLDPVGCGAQNLSECLLAQARVLEERSPLVELVIRDHLEDLKNKDLENISKVTGVALEKILEAQTIIQSFHPKPGRLISSEEIQYVVPDIYVQEVGGEFVVQVNDEGVPRLRVSQLYQQMLKNSTDPNAKEYVQEKLRSAMWLIKSIQNRQRTIVKVSNAIVRQQQIFFKKGPKFLKPMVLKDVANEIGMHESTVSRVTTNKYMHTPIGLFELKYFFNSGIGGKDGGVDVSSEVLKIKIKAFVENENPSKPLSDQKIAELLSREDINVARRTVAKYREILAIASSSKRKVKK